ERPGAHRDSIEQALRAMLTESIPAIGLADLGEDSTTVRLSVRDAGSTATSDTVNVGRTSIEIPSSTPLAKLLAVADVADPDHVRPAAGVIVLALGPAAVARARARGLESAAVAERFTRLGLRQPFASAVAEVVEGLGTQRQVGLMAVSAAIVVDDPGL